MALPLSTNMPDARPLPYENIRILDPSRSAPLASIKDTNAMPREAAKMIVINDTDTLQLMMSYMCHDEPYVQDRSSLQSNLFCASHTAYWLQKCAELAAKIIQCCGAN